MLVSKKEEVSHEVTELFPGINVASYLTVSEAALDRTAPLDRDDIAELHISSDGSGWGFERHPEERAR